MSDYDKGVNDCKAGRVAPLGMSDMYYEGYRKQYDKEQRESAK